MRVQGPLLVDVVVVMLVGQSQSVLAVHPVVAGDHGVARDLVYRVAVVGVVIHWDRPPGVLTETGGNVGKMKSQFVPEEPIRPVDGRVGLHVVPQVGVQLSGGDVAQDQDHRLAAGLQHLVESRADIVPGPLVDDVVVGENQDGPLAALGGLTDGVRHVVGLRQVGVVETDSEGRLPVLQLRTEDLRHEVVVLDAVAHVGVVHLLLVGVRERGGMAEPSSPS